MGAASLRSLQPPAQSRRTQQRRRARPEAGCPSSSRPTAAAADCDVCAGDGTRVVPFGDPGPIARLPSHGAGVAPSIGPTFSRPYSTVT